MPSRIDESIILPLLIPLGHAAMGVPRVCVYGDVHVGAAIEVASFLNSALKSNDDGMKLGSLARWYWIRPSWQLFGEGFILAPFSLDVACAGTKGSPLAVISATSVDVHDHYVDHLVAVERLQASS